MLNGHKLSSDFAIAFIRKIVKLTHITFNCNIDELVFPKHSKIYGDIFFGMSTGSKGMNILRGNKIKQYYVKYFPKNCALYTCI